ncbi:MAG: hypothetical protein L3K19_09430 [Thermoplasmata archaeon]|nr:hypothetical protein [Thermoplasmata archaeon]
MPSVSVYLTDEEWTAVEDLAVNDETVKDVLKRYAELTLAEYRKKATKGRK